MAKLSITCDTLGDLDGGTGRLLVDAEIKKAVEDLYDRAEEDGKPRKVVIELEVTVKENIVVAHLRAQAKLPPRQTKGTVAGVRHVEGKPDLFFQSMAPGNPAQRTIDEFVNETEEVNDAT